MNIEAVTKVSKTVVFLHVIVDVLQANMQYAFSMSKNISNQIFQ